MIWLPYAANEAINFANLSYSALVLVATLCYGTNVHVVGNYLKDIPSVVIAAVAFMFYIPVCLVILFITGFFNLHLTQNKIAFSILASAVLGTMGTALATVAFYKLVKTAGSIFASTVTYGIPVIAIIWGLIFGESVTITEIFCLLMILAGVYLVNKKQRT